MVNCTTSLVILSEIAKTLAIAHVAKTVDLCQTWWKNKRDKFSYIGLINNLHRALKQMNDRFKDGNKTYCMTI